MSRTIKINIFRALLANSGNRCAFPGCNQPIVNEEHKFIGQLCHIEAFSPNGPRYNVNQTEDERNGYDNLLFMCYKHHNETHDAYKYPVSRLKEIKYEHEKQYKYNPYQFDFSLIYKINDECREYCDKIEELDKKSDIPDDMRMSIKMNVSFRDLMKEINEAVDYIEDYSNSIRIESDSLNDRIIKKLASLGYNIDKWKEQSYYDNEFEIPHWEILHLGFPTCINTIKYRLIQVEILYYTEHIKLNPNDELEQQQLEKLKKELLSLSGNIVYYD